MSNNGNDGLSDKERALIATARQSLGARKSPAASPPPAVSPPATPTTPIAAAPIATRVAKPAAATKPEPTPAVPAMGAAERIALLMQAEREQSEARKRRLRRWGIYAPLGVLVTMVLWTAVAALRQTLN